MRKITTAFAGMSILLSACAQQPENISASYVPPTTYSNLQCDQIIAERNRIVHKVNELTGAQNKKANADAVAMGVGLVVFWPALFFLAAGSDKEAELANYKGHYDALTQEGIRKGCIEIAPEQASSAVAVPSTESQNVSTVVTPTASADTVAPAAGVAAAIQGPDNTSVVNSSLELTPLPTQTSKLPGHRVVGRGCPGFAPRLLYAESPDKLPRNCESVDAL